MFWDKISVICSIISVFCTAYNFGSVIKLQNKKEKILHYLIKNFYDEMNIAIEDKEVDDFNNKVAGLLMEIFNLKNEMSVDEYKVLSSIQNYFLGLIRTDINNSEELNKLEYFLNKLSKLNCIKWKLFFSGNYFLK